MWGVRNAVTFYLGIIRLNNHVCICSPANRLSESANKLMVHAVLGVWPQFWCLKLGISPFCDPGTRKVRLFIAL